MNWSPLVVGENSLYERFQLSRCLRIINREYGSDIHKYVQEIVHKLLERLS